MKRNSVFIFGVLVVVAISAFAYAMSEQEGVYSWRYKITVTVETPEGVKTGSAVREVVNRTNTLLGLNLPDVGARISSVKGEAVVIDLGNRGILFALIDNGSYAELYSTFSVKDASNKTDDFYNLKLGASAQLPEADWPMFVMFSNISDPKSVVLARGWRFDPQTQKQLSVDDFSKYAGEGTYIKDITIEIVDEPVTWGSIDRYLSKDFWEKYRSWTKSTKINEREFTRLFRFKEGI